MTAEIAILNKGAVALAADSAITFNHSEGRKIFPSGNKILALSKYEPVGFMFYNNASFMEVPWEIIIKLYRDNLGRDNFDTLEEYVNSFIEFLQTNIPFVTPGVESRWINVFVCHFLGSNLHARALALAKETLKKQEFTNDELIPFIEQSCVFYESTFDQKRFAYFKLDQTAKRYSDLIKGFIIHFYPGYNIQQGLLQKLVEVCLYITFTDVEIVMPNFSGIVITGFGRNDIFPSLRSYRLYGRANGILRYASDQKHDIAFENNAVLAPFAQGDTILTFLTGVNPNLEQAILNDVNALAQKMPEIIIDKITSLLPDEKTKAITLAQQQCAQLHQQAINSISLYKNTKFITPLINVIAMLDKSELATMAETLISLTSFKVRISLDSETVGGPVDVALISKKDGFVWIKHKHYFPAELNHSFFQNNMGEKEDA